MITVLLLSITFLYLLGAAMCYGYETMEPAREVDRWVVLGWPAFALTACFASLIICWFPDREPSFDTRWFK